MTTPLDEQSLRQLFLDARTHNGFLDKPVSDETLHALWDLAKWGPTAMNCLPMRLVFVKSPEAKEKLRPALADGNLAKTMAAPVTVIVATDFAFHERLPTLFPAYPGARDMFAGNSAARESTAVRNGNLQAGYLIMAARALGLACGPMSGFDDAKLDEAFFAGTAVKSNLLVNLGYAAVPPVVHPRGARPDFSEDCRIA
jgi:3-hydroxypropanoate dehydrogenase